MDAGSGVDLLDSALNFIGAAAALGTAAFGLVDGSKAFRGGVSNAGFGHLKRALAPFTPQLELAGRANLLELVRANWLNGKPLEDQKAAAKSLIRVGIQPHNAAALAENVGVDPAALEAAARRIYQGETLTREDINILGRFDVLVEAILDVGFERADQMYRNSAKATSAAVAVVLALVAAYLIGASYLSALFAGIVATPLAPMFKDLTSSLQSAASALKAGRGGS